MPSSTPEQTLDVLCRIFPPFRFEWEESATAYSEADEFTHHAVMIEFTTYFGTHLQSFTDEQVEAFAAWVNEAVLKDGELENAVATCFLEHMTQIGVAKRLRPKLSQVARSKARA
jgi:hypothetical protein